MANKIIIISYNSFEWDCKFPTCSEDTGNCQFAVLEQQTVMDIGNTTTTTVYVEINEICFKIWWS